MNPELITFTYNNIVKATLGNIFQTIESAQNNTPMIDFNLFAKCLKFVVMFRNF